MGGVKAIARWLRVSLGRCRSVAGGVTVRRASDEAKRGGTTRFVLNVRVCTQSEANRLCLARAAAIVRETQSLVERDAP